MERCPCRIARSSRWPSAGWSERSEWSASACCAVSSRSCRTTAAARSRTSGSGSRRRSSETRVRAKVVHRDSIAVRREGAAQVALVGAPNAGKSSLLQALSQIQIKTGDYAFTTTRPIAAVTSVGGVRVQLVEIPGLLEGASEGRGGGRALLGVLRNADAIVYCHAASVVAGGPDHSASRGRGGRHRAARSARGDQGGRGRRARRPPRGRVRRSRARARVRSRRCEPRERFARRSGVSSGSSACTSGTAVGVDDEPLALEPGATVEDVADAIHHELAASFRAARIWGPSARFDGQRVGRAHVVADLDEVEILH